MRLRARSYLALLCAAGAALAVLAIALLLPAAAAASGDPTDMRAAVLAIGTGAVLAAAAAGFVAAAPLARGLQALRERLSAFPAGGAHAPIGGPVQELRAAGAALERATAAVSDSQARLTRERGELAALIGAVGEGLLHLDAGGRILRHNPAAGRLLGLPDAARAQPYATAIRSGALRAVIARALQGPVPDPTEIELDGRRVLVIAQALREPNASAGAGAVIVLVDLTQVRRLETVRRDFVANVSHEMKTPLTSIRGYAETLLGEDVPDEMRRRFLRTIHENATRLQRIVDDLLDLSSVESGGWQPAPEPVVLADAAAEAWQPFADRARRQGVSFAVRGASDARAHADPMALRQILANLYDNALRYTPADGRITAQVATDQEGAVRLDISDTGAGIPRESLPRIFERFYRVDPARSRAEGGTGLGLAIVKHMVESMRGRVSAESETGKGTTIRIQLPGA